MKQKVYTVFLAFFLLFITSSMIIFPKESLHASIHGLDTWWKIVFPSLLPFFITAELLIRFGVVKFIGVLFEPIMRPLFNVPGIGSFAWIVGMASGYPSGAKITALLREKKQISQIEAERLVSFSNAASPLFIFGAIAVGLFHKPETGIIIALSHYIGNIFVGIAMRFYGKTKDQKKNNKTNRTILIRAFQNMHRTRLEGKQPIGEILGESVQTSVQTLLMIGGFIILFSVLISLFQVMNITAIIQFIVTPLFLLFHIPEVLISGLFTGTFEITLGARVITKLSSISMTIKLVCISLLLGFNGLSIHAQVASILAKTDIRYISYFYGRVLHAVFSGFICFIILLLFSNSSIQITNSIPAFLIPTSDNWHWLNKLYEIGPFITIISISIAFLYLLHVQFQEHRSK